MNVQDALEAETKVTRSTFNWVAVWGRPHATPMTVDVRCFHERDGKVALVVVPEFSQQHATKIAHAVRHVGLTTLQNLKSV